MLSEGYSTWSVCLSVYQQLFSQLFSYYRLRGDLWAIPARVSSLIAHALLPAGYAHVHTCKMPRGCSEGQAVFHECLSSVLISCSLFSQWITSWARYVRHVVQRFTWDEQFVDATLHSHLQSGNNNYVVRKQWNTEERIKLMWETLKHLSNCSNRYPLVQLACDMARNWLAG